MPRSDMTDDTFILFAQHGWADHNQDMLRLARQLVDGPIPIIAPDLRFIQTWIRIDVLVLQVEAIALGALRQHPDLPWRIIGHSMGGLIWLEVLHRHPEWWSNVHSLVLLASPVGGADLGRIIDPFKFGLGIAADLGKDRKAIAETIAAEIPTLVIAGDVDRGSDGTVPVTATRIAHAQFVRLPNIAHAELKTHPAVVALIKDFWADFQIGVAIAPDPIIYRLRSVPGITDGHERDFGKAEIYAMLQDGRTLRVWKNLLEVHHVFVGSPDGECLYAGFVGWLHTADLWAALREIKATNGV